MAAISQQAQYRKSQTPQKKTEQGQKQPHYRQKDKTKSGLSQGQSKYRK